MKPPWFNNRLLQISNTLPLLDHSSTYLNQDFGCQNHNSWFSSSKIKALSTRENTFLPSSRKINDVHITNHKTKRSKTKLNHNQILRSFKIRVWLNKEQKKLFHQWAEVCRLAYNRAIEVYKHHKKNNLSTDWRVIKSNILNSEKNTKFKPTHILFDKKKCPYDPKASAIHELCSNVHSAEQSLKSNEKEYVTPVFKQRKKGSPIKTINIEQNGGNPSVKIIDSKFKFWPKTNVGEIAVFNSCKSDLTKLRNYLPNGNCTRQVKFKFEFPNRYYLIFPVVYEKKSMKPISKIMATDPGVRIFHSTYDSGGCYKDYGSGQISKLINLGRKYSNLQSQFDILKQSKQQENYIFLDGDQKKQIKSQLFLLKREMANINHKIKDLKTDCHKKIIKEWVNEYSDIMIPQFKVSQMVRKTTRRISKDTVKKLMHWSHFAFRQRLKTKAEVEGLNIQEVDESYTTQTCTNCYKRNSVKNNMYYKCDNCGFTSKRDTNSSRCIYVKNIEESIGTIREIE